MPRKVSEVVRKSIGWPLLVGQGGNQNSYEVRSQDRQAGIPLYAAVMPGRCLHRAICIGQNDLPRNRIAVYEMLCGRNVSADVTYG